MEKQDKFNEIAYKKAQKRVKDIKNFYYMVIGYVVFSYFILGDVWSGNIFHVKRPENIWMISLWGIFLLGYGIYLFVPYFHKWEERKTRELMNKYNQKN